MFKKVTIIVTKLHWMRVTSNFSKVATQLCLLKLFAVYSGNAVTKCHMVKVHTSFTL